MGRQRINIGGFPIYNAEVLITKNTLLAKFNIYSSLKLKPFPSSMNSPLSRGNRTGTRGIQLVVQNDCRGTKTNLQTIAAYNSKELYAKKFFQRRFQIEMEVLSRAVREAEQLRRAGEEPEQKRVSLGRFQGTVRSRQKNKWRSCNTAKKTEAYSKNSRKQPPEKDPASNKNNILASCKGTTKITKEGVRTNPPEDRFDFHLDLRAFLSNNHHHNACRDPCSDKRAHYHRLNPNDAETQIHEHFHRLNQQLQRNKQKTTNLMESLGNSIALYSSDEDNNPENLKHAERTKLANITSKRMYKETNEWSLLQGEQRYSNKVIRGWKREAKGGRRPCNAKYSINNENRKRIAEIIESQRSVHPEL
jgi:hypothetical protein